MLAAISGSSRDRLGSALSKRGKDLVTTYLAHIQGSVTVCFEHCDEATCGGLKGEAHRAQPE